MFLPSGRCHAIGGGNVIFEIQQNSDTTYRVFDWNRVEADGKPRQLHIPESLASIDFEDCVGAELRASLTGSVEGQPLMWRDFRSNAPRGGNTHRILLIGGIHGDEFSSVSIIFQ